MKRKSPILLPSALKIMAVLGQNLKLARLRRKLSANLVAERANISRATLWSIEKGSPRVAMGAYLQVLFALGLESEFKNLCSDDVLGRKLQDAGLIVKARATKAVKKD